MAMRLVSVLGSLLRCGVLALVAVTGHAACSSSDAPAATPGPCAGGATTPVSCGTDCTTSPCGDGFYCGADSRCTADCTAGGVECGEGSACDPDGHCVLAGGGLFRPDAGLNGRDARSCIDETVGFERLIPTVIVLVDRSGSMKEDFGGGVSRWESLRRTLIDPATGILLKVQDRVRLGLTMYTSFDGSRNGGTCPILVDVPPALNNAAAITSVYSMTELVHDEDDTPTADSLAVVTQKLMALKDAGPKAILLATDGEPDTCVDPDAHNPETNALSVTAVRNAFAAGITTQVISVGSEVGQPHLQDLANAGVGGQGGTPYRALDAQALTKAFEEIVHGVVSCEFTLDGTVAAGKETTGKVVLDGTPLVYADTNGWDLTSPSRLRLKGSACESAKEAGRVLHIQFPCDSYVKVR